MRILFLLTQSLDSPGGAGRFLPMAKALAAQGIEVAILALHPDFEHAPAGWHSPAPGIDVRYVAQMHVRKSGHTKQYFKPYQLPLITLMATLKLTTAGLGVTCDAVQICKAQPMNGIAGRLIGLLRRKPVFLDSDDFEQGNNRFQGKWQQKIVSLFENWLPSFAHTVFVGNSFILNHYRDIGVTADKLVLVPNGVDEEIFERPDVAQTAARVERLRRSLNLPTDRFPIAYVGTISLTSHALDLMLLAFQQARRSNPALYLILVGGGEDFDTIKQLAASVALTDHLCFVGQVPYPAVPDYYRLGRFTLDPRGVSDASASTLSLKLFESLACGIPCITTDIGDRRQHAQQGCIMVEPDDVAALAEAIVTLSTDPALLKRLTAESVAVATQTFWRHRVEGMIERYTTALGPTPNQTAF